MKLMIDVSKSFSPKKNDIFVYDGVKGWKVINKAVYEANIDKKLVLIRQQATAMEAGLLKQIIELDAKLELAKKSISDLAQIMEEE